MVQMPAARGYRGVIEELQRSYRGVIEEQPRGNSPRNWRAHLFRLFLWFLEIIGRFGSARQAVIVSSQAQQLAGNH
jgi:hypothetical protein